MSRLSARAEDYLEAVLDIEMSGRTATVTQIANNLGVTKATIATAMKKLAASGLLLHENYGDVILTEEGLRRALSVYRRHLFLTDFFSRILGLSRESAQRVSCVMEHEIDEDSERRIAAFADAMAAAKRRGDEWFLEIQRKLDSAVDSLPVPLCYMPDGSSGRIARITAFGDLRRRLTAGGFVSGAEISNIEKVDGERGCAFSFEMNGIGIKMGMIEASSVWLNATDTDS